MSIGKITTGSSFGGVVRYASQKDGAKVLDTNLAGASWQGQAAEMEAMAASSNRCTTPVFHASLSASPGEHPTDEQWVKAASVYKKEMGFSDEHQFILIKHSDREHDHVHLIMNRVDQSGKAVSMQHNFQRSKEAMRTAEREAGLQAYAGKVSERGQGRMVELRSQIDEAMRDAPSLETFKARCRASGLDVIENRASGTGRLSGLSFQASSDGKVWKGSEIGKGYSLNGLQKRGLRLESEKHPLLKAHAKPERIQPSATSNKIMKKMGVPSLPTPTRLLTRAVKAALSL